MAKRFTDTDKWKKPGFKNLSLKMRWAWLFLCDNCDHAGIWIIDLSIMRYYIGIKITLDELVENLNVEVRENYLLVKDFCAFQYGTLNPSNRVHASVLQSLQSFNNKALTSPIQGAKDKDKDKDKEKERGEWGENKPTKEDLELIYQTYPRKIGKQNGIEKLKRSLEDRDEIVLLKMAIANFNAYHKKKNTEEKFIPHFSTWVSSWRDWIDDDHGSTLKHKDLKTDWLDINSNNQSSEGEENGI